MQLSSHYILGTLFWMTWIFLRLVLTAWLQAATPYNVVGAIIVGTIIFSSSGSAEELKVEARDRSKLTIALPCFAAWVIWTCHVSLLFQISPRHFIRCSHGILVPLNSMAFGGVTRCVVNITTSFYQGFFLSSTCLPGAPARPGRPRVCCWQLGRCCSWSGSVCRLQTALFPLLVEWVDLSQMQNRIGDKTATCGTPASVVVVDDLRLPTRTWNVLFLKLEFRKWIIFVVHSFGAACVCLHSSRLIKSFIDIYKNGPGQVFFLERFDLLRLPLWFVVPLQVLSAGRIDVPIEFVIAHYRW